MYSSEDLERFYFQYQSEALPLGESLQSFCVKNKVPYNIFQKWFKDTRKKVVEVQVDGAPVIIHEETTKTNDQLKSVAQSSNENPVRIWIDIRISNGLHLSQNNLFKEYFENKKAIGMDTILNKEDHDNLQNFIKETKFVYPNNPQSL